VKKNKKNREKLAITHSAGTKAFSRVRYENVRFLLCFSLGNMYNSSKVALKMCIALWLYKTAKSRDWRGAKPY
jgi:hypothetical protein